MKMIKHGVYGQRLSCRTCGAIFEVEGKEDIHRYANGFLFSGIIVLCPECGSEVPWSPPRETDDSDDDKPGVDADSPPGDRA